MVEKTYKKKINQSFIWLKFCQEKTTNMIEIIQRIPFNTCVTLGV